MNLLRTTSIILLCVTLAGCASFGGMPKPLFTNADVDKVIANYSPAQVMLNANSPPGGVTREEYRNAVASAYLMALDTRYQYFKRSLSRTKKGSNVGFDIAMLGLTGVASVWDDVAQEFAAGATVLGGSRASLDKELFAEKALPVLVTLMDSGRLKVRAEITRGLAKPASEYGVAQMFADLMRYESAGSIDVALSQAAGDAAERAVQANYEFSQAIALCQTTPDVAAARKTLMRDLETINTDAAANPSTATSATSRQKLLDAATSAGVPGASLETTAEGLLGQLVGIRNHLDTLCEPAALDQFKQALQARNVIP